MSKPMSDDERQRVKAILQRMKGPGEAVQKAQEAYWKEAEAVLRESFATMPEEIRQKFVEHGLDINPDSIIAAHKFARTVADSFVDDLMLRLVLLPDHEHTASLKVPSLNVIRKVEDFAETMKVKEDVAATTPEGRPAFAQRQAKA